MPCPGPDPLAASATAATAHRFLIICLTVRRQGSGLVQTGSDVYQFSLTRTGRVTGLQLVPGGKLPGLRAGTIAASAGGSRWAVTIASAKGGDVTEILVTDTSTGKRAVWQAGLLPGDAKSGGARFLPEGLSFARGGRTLAVFGDTECPAGKDAACKSPGEAMLTVNSAGKGGQLASGREIFTQAELTGGSRRSVTSAFISSDGSTVTAGFDNRRAPTVVRVSVATGQRRILYQSPNRHAFLWDLSPDPSGRFVLIVTTTGRRDVNGWLDHGKLAPIKPVTAPIALEAW